MADRPPPLVSCLMPTHNRRRFVPLAVRYFLRQDYPRRELIVLDDGTDPVEDLMPDDDRVVYVRLGRRLSVGAKRNRAGEVARGEVLAHWDDDDWHGPERLRQQVAALADGAADLCGLARPLFYDPERGRAWRYRYGGRRPWVAGGTMAYRRSLWAERPFADVSDGEDTRFAWGTAPDRVRALDGAGDWFVGLVHGGGSSRKRLQSSRWRARPVAEVEARLGDDVRFYTGRAEIPASAPLTSPPAPASVGAEPPRVTVAVPTVGPPDGLRRAVESILRQTYPHLRVVVVNDGGAPPWDALARLDDPRLVRFDLEANRGRYFADAVVLAATDDALFMTQDADDWSEPDRVAALLARLDRDGADVAYSAAYHCQAEDPAARWIKSCDDLLSPLGRPFVHRAHHPAALYRSEALRRVGGPFGGYRIGYDTLLVNLLRLTARVAYEPRPLMTYCMREGSLTSAAATGLGSAERDRVWAELEGRYQEARALAARQRRGEIRADTLAELIRQRATRGVTAEDRAALAVEAGRLRVLLGVPAPAPPTAPLPLDEILGSPRVGWSGWTVSEPFAHRLAEHLADARPARCLEAGSGVSTLVFAHHAARQGAHVTTLEHDPTWFEATADRLDAAGLRDAVDLRYAPITGTPEGPWYDTPLDGPYDFAFVDGPPLRVGRTAALPALRPHLAADWTLWLKDGHRAHERACVTSWGRRLRFRQRLWDGDPSGVWVLSAEATAPAAVGAAAPLATCLMPTRDRRPFVAQAVAYFLRQDYPNRELVVVDDGDDPVRDLLPDDPRVVYVRLSERASIGAKRNRAIEAASGEVLVCWDDDDWHGPGRLRAQVEPIARGGADVTALGRSPFYSVPTGRFWECSPRVHGRMFFRGVVGGTMAFRRARWRAGARFPDRSMAEDAHLLRQLLRGGARLAAVEGEGLFVYIRHGANSWRFAEGEHVDRAGWHVVPPPHGFGADDLAFYQSLRPGAHRAGGARGSSPRPDAAPAGVRKSRGCLSER